MHIRDFLNYYDQLTEETDEEAIRRLEKELAELEAGEAPTDAAPADSAPADTGSVSSSEPTTSTTPAVENPGYEGQQLEIWNLLSPEQKRWATGSKGTGMPNLMDPVIQSRISRVKGGTMLVDPDRQKEITKAAAAAKPGRSGPPDMAARKRLMDLAYQPGTELPKQPEPAPIVDKPVTVQDFKSPKKDQKSDTANSDNIEKQVTQKPKAELNPPATSYSPDPNKEKPSGDTQVAGGTKPWDGAGETTPPTAQAQIPKPGDNEEPMLPREEEPLPDTSQVPSPPAQSYSPEPEDSDIYLGGKMEPSSPSQGITGGGGYSQGLPSLDNKSAKVNNAAQVSTAQRLRDLMKKIG